MSDHMTRILEEDLPDAISDINDRGCCSLTHTAERLFALEDSPEKERMLIRLAAECVWYASNLREERGETPP